MIIEAKAGEFGDAKLLPENAFGIVALESPILEAGLDPACTFEEGSLRGFEELLRAGEKRFARVEQLEFVAESFVGSGAGKFGGLEFAGGKIDESEADRRTGRVPRNGGQEIVFADIEHPDVRCRAGRDDANYFPANEFFAWAGLLHLIADSDFETGADQPRDVGFGGVIRHAAHGNGLAFFAIAGSQGDLQFPRGDHGIFIEEFVEIAETEEQQGVRVARLDGVILLHQRCSWLAHSGVFSR